ncbi:MAG: T9SS type A sorting domain-containing protein [Flavobacteriales bacterium]|nr:T9SS type A sorting domain-containing protein [Flavobacteriales bacterium]
MSYSQAPQEMAPLLKFSADVVNYGSQTQTNATLRSRVFDVDGSTQLVSLDSELQTMEPEDDFEIRSGTYQLPSDVGRYPITYQALADQDEDTPIDNLDNSFIDITEAVYSRDRLETDGIYVPPSVYNGTPYEIGNMFVINADGQECHSISAGLSVGSNTASSVFAAIYKVNVSNGLQTTLVAETEEIPVETSAFNGIGDNRVMVIPFTEPVALAKDSAYFAVVGTQDGPENVFFPVSGDSPQLTSFVRFLPNTWFFMISTPMVRMNFDVVTNIDEDQAIRETDLNAYPNPVDDILTLTFETSKSGVYQAKVIGMDGKEIMTRNLGNLTVGEHLGSLDVSHVASGTYQLVILSDGDLVKRTTIVKK